MSDVPEAIDPPALENLLSEFREDDRGLLAPALGVVWRLYADKQNVAPRLRWLYAKRELLDILLQHRYPEAVTQLGDAQYADQRKALTDIRTSVQDEIDRTEASARALRPPLVAQIQVSSGYSEREQRRMRGPDPNSDLFRGSPLRTPLEEPG
jgi:hypothetical protein